MTSTLVPPGSQRVRSFSNSAKCIKGLSDGARDPVTERQQRILESQRICAGRMISDCIEQAKENVALVQEMNRYKNLVLRMKQTLEHMEALEEYGKRLAYQNRQLKSDNKELSAAINRISRTFPSR
jgi:predicted RNase H-like nuclease (RuvC/YqgF family)